MLIYASGCSLVSIDAWDYSNTPQNGQCPGDERDNGGAFHPEPGMCKTGRGVFVTINHRFKG